MKSRVTGAEWICVAMLTMAVLLCPAMTSAANLNGFLEWNYGTYSIFGNDAAHTYYRWNGTGQGWSHSNIPTGNWCYLGKFLDKGASGWYMPGDGAWHNISAAWAYIYLGGTGCWWTPTVGSTVFAYNYGQAQWYDAGKVGGWGLLGSRGMSAAFMGDGTWHNLSATWAYNYSGGVGSWWTPTIGARMFSYNYSTGQWSDQGVYGSWQTLGAAGASASFIGDGTWHNLSAIWAYNYSGGVGSWWTPTVGTSVFSYNYVTGQWSDQGKYGGWHPLTHGIAGTSAAFMGDGAWHLVGGTAGVGSFYYMYDNVAGYWNLGGPLMGSPSPGYFAYSYIYLAGEWYHQSAWGGWQALGKVGGVSASFVGDGNKHYVGGDWSYQLYSSLIGEWKSSTDTYNYQYIVGVWKWWNPNWGWESLTGFYASAALPF